MAWSVGRSCITSKDPGALSSPATIPSEGHAATHSPGAASDMDKPVETLKNMNLETAKHAQWVVRVLAPKLIRYSFQAKQKTVQAEKFQCLLVSTIPTQFMIGSVPFNFAAPQAARQAFQKFREGLCFRVQQPEFDGRMKAEYISTPIKRALLLTNPATVTAVPPTATDALKDVADHVDVGMSLTNVLGRLNKMYWPQTQTLSGGTRQTQLLNLCGKVNSISSAKQVIVAGRTRKVSAMELADQEASLVEVHVWDEAHEQLEGVNEGEGITIVGCSAQREANSELVKLNLWDSGYVLKSGPKAQALSSWNPQQQSLTKLTTVFTPSNPLLPTDCESLPTCAAALANSPKLSEDRVIQVNRCLIDIPTREEQMFTQDGKRLYSSCRLRDWSGAVDVDLVSEAMLTLYGCKTQEEVREALATGALKVTLSRVNARGTLRPTDTGSKTLIGQIEESPLDAPVSAKAMRAMLGLSEVSGEVVLAAPAGRVQDLSGLALESSDRGFLPAHRVLLLVKGTTSSTLEPIGETGQSLTAQSFRVASKDARCLLSDSEVYVNLYGYCDFSSMLQHRLDKDTALVLASALEVAPDTQEKTFTVEHMVKVQDVDKLKTSLDIEWKIVLLSEANEEREQYASPTKAEYWDRDVKKLKRMVSEP